LTSRPGVKESILKTLWSIRHLSENTQRTYSKHLKRLASNCARGNVVGGAILTAFVVGAVAWLKGR